MLTIMLVLYVFLEEGRAETTNGLQGSLTFRRTLLSDTSVELECKMAYDGMIINVSPLLVLFSPPDGFGGSSAGQVYFRHASICLDKRLHADFPVYGGFSRVGIEFDVSSKGHSEEMFVMPVDNKAHVSKAWYVHGTSPGVLFLDRRSNVWDVFDGAVLTPDRLTLFRQRTAPRGMHVTEVNCNRADPRKERILCEKFGACSSCTANGLTVDSVDARYERKVDTNELDFSPSTNYSIAIDPTIKRSHVPVSLYLVMYHADGTPRQGSSVALRVPGADTLLELSTEICDACLVNPDSDEIVLGMDVLKHYSETWYLAERDAFLLVFRSHLSPTAAFFVSLIVVVLTIALVRWLTHEFRTLLVLMHPTEKNIHDTTVDLFRVSQVFWLLAAVTASVAMVPLTAGGVVAKLAWSWYSCLCSLVFHVAMSVMVLVVHRIHRATKLAVALLMIANLSFVAMVLCSMQLGFLVLGNKPIFRVLTGLVVLGRLYYFAYYVIFWVALIASTFISVGRYYAAWIMFLLAFVGVAVVDAYVSTWHTLPTVLDSFTTDYSLQVLKLVSALLVFSMAAAASHVLVFQLKQAADKHLQRASTDKHKKK